MPFSKLAESRINEAVARGEFDNLPNAGQPLDLDTYFSAPADLRMAYSVLKSADCVPIEVELLKEVARLREAVAQAPDAAERLRLERLLLERQTHLAMRLERRPRGEK